MGNGRSTHWTKKKCVSCEGSVQALSKEDALRNIKPLKGWLLSGDAKSIRAEYLMKDFMAAIGFIRRIGELAEREGHHPDIHLTGYRRLLIQISTHAIGGLSDNDFILAAKIDRLPRKLQKS